MRALLIACLFVAGWAHAQECLPAKPSEPIELYDAGHYYTQQGKCVDLYRDPSMLQELGAPYGRLRAQQGISQALLLTGVLLPALWTLQGVTLQLNGPDWFGLYYFNRYTVGVSLALGLSALIPRYFAMQNLDLLVQKHNARLGFKYAF